MNNINKNKLLINSLIQVVIQEDKSNKVLMLGYMNNDSLNKTINNGFVYFWSRSKNKLWMKGEKSGNKLKVVEICSDCDSDALLIKVRLIGSVVCHKGYKSCFYNKLAYDF